MKSNFFNSFYERLHPAIGKIGIFEWDNLKAGDINTPLYLWGDDISCELFRQRFKANNIKYEGIINSGFGDNLNSLPEGATVIVTLKDFPSDITLYYNVSSQLAKIGIKKPYIIRDFSSGFALGSEHVVRDRNKIESSYWILGDEDSKACFEAFLENSVVPYHWNMDITADVFGIPDPYRPDNHKWNYGDLDNNIAEKSFVLFCITGEFKRNDPNYELLNTHSNCVVLCPDSLSRLRMRECFNHALVEHGIPIIDKTLWDSDKTVYYQRYKWHGGTPLYYSGKSVRAQGIALDRLVACSKGMDVSLLILNMNEDYIHALRGAKTYILNNRVEVRILGFHTADCLWNAITRINTEFPEKDILLRRYFSENPLEGHCIVIK